MQVIRGYVIFGTTATSEIFKIAVNPGLLKNSHICHIWKPTLKGRLSEDEKLIVVFLFAENIILKRKKLFAEVLSREIII